MQRGSTEHSESKLGSESNCSNGDIEGAVDDFVPVHMAKRSQVSIHSIDPGEGSGGFDSSGRFD